MRLMLKGIKKKKGRSRYYYYAWLGGPRLEGEPGSPEFLASYNAAIATRKAPEQNEGKFISLVALYKSTTEFSRLAPRTKTDYLKKMKLIEDRFGDMPLTVLDDKRARGIFKGWRDELAASSSRQADYAWSVLARIISIAKDRGVIGTNPCEKGGRLYDGERTDAVWTEDAERQFRRSAPEHLHLALLLAMWTGQREGDLLKLTWGNYDGATIRLRQGKTRRAVIIPVGEPLRIAMDAEKAKKRGMTILLTKDGKPWSGDGFRSSWRKACAKAGIHGLTFHDIRGTAITYLAQAGASVPEIATVTGHSLRDVEAILDAYYLSRDAGLARSAVTKLEAHRKKGSEDG